MAQISIDRRHIVFGVSVCLQVLTFDQTHFPTPALFRCLRGNLCTNVDEDKKHTVDHEDGQKPSFRKESAFCRVSILGRVGTVPQTINVGENSFVSFLVGVQSYSNKMHWHQVNVNRLTMQHFVMKSIMSGDRIIVEGNLWYTLDERIKRYKISAENIVLISKKYKKDDPQLADVQHTESLEMLKET